MGIMRVLLSVSVMFAHYYGFMLVGGLHAVEMFYMISGFLISFVLLSQNSYKKNINFYINRYLRIFPVYAVIAILTLIFYFHEKMTFFLSIYQVKNTLAIAMLVVSNVIIFFQDWFFFLTVNGGKLTFLIDASKDTAHLARGLVLPQAWTLGAELMFYLIAPFVVKRKAILWPILILSLAIKLRIAYVGLNDVDPWSYRFFPSELCLFLLGAVSHQYLYPLYKKLSGFQLNVASWSAVIFMVCSCVFYVAIPMTDDVKGIWLLGIFAVLLPLMFCFQKNNAFDRFIGELSYPSYISHLLVFWYLSKYRGRFGDLTQLQFSIVCIVATLIFSYFLCQVVVEPMERVRAKWRSRNVAGVI